MGLLAGILSFFVPGLGQLVQGRIGAVIKIYILFGIAGAIGITGIGLIIAAPLGILIELWQLIGALKH
mgnify:CR=1 FL=1